MNIQEIEEKEKTESLEELKKILERLNSTISIEEMQEYYGIILGAYVNKDINNKEYMNALSALKTAKINQISENKKEIYKQIQEVIDEQIEKCAEKIVQKKYKKIKQLNSETTNITTPELFIKLCEEFDYCEIKQIEGVNYVEWASILNELEPICTTDEEIKIVNDYKNALKNYLEQKTK